MNIFGGGKSDACLIVDVGNGSVGAGVAVLAKGAKPKMICSARELVTFEEKPTEEKLREIILNKLEKVVPFVLKQAFTDVYFKSHPKRMAKVLCVLSSPWFSAKGKVLDVEEKNNFTITRAFLDDVVSKELAIFEEEINQSDKENPEGERNLRVIERSVIGSKVKGYSLEDVIGKSTNQIEMSVYMSYADNDFIKKLSNTISKSCHAPDKDFIFHSFPLVTFSAMREMFPGMNDYIHFDIAGEITDVSWVSANMIKKIISFPSGKNLVIRQIGKQFNVPTEIARSLLHLYMEKRADKNVEAGIHTALLDAEKEWNIYIEDMINSLSGEPSTSEFTDQVIATPRASTPLPKKVFITSYPQTAELFTDFLTRDSVDATASFRKSMSVSYLGPDVLASFLTYNQTQSFDAFLAIEALFLSRVE